MCGICFRRVQQIFTMVLASTGNWLCASIRFICFVLFLSSFTFQLPIRRSKKKLKLLLLTMSVTELSRRALVWERSFYFIKYKGPCAARDQLQSTWDVVHSPSIVLLSIIILIVSGIIADIGNCRERPCASEWLHLKRMHRIEHPREYQPGICSPYSHAD